MLSRKEIDKSDIVERSNSMAPKESPCLERNLEELPGYVEVEVVFDSNKQILSKPFKISIPVCYLQVISNKDEVEFEKTLLKNENYHKNNMQNELESLVQEFQIYNRYLNEVKALNEIALEESKIILHKLQNSTPVQLDNIAKTVDDSEENIEVKVF